MAWLLFAGLCFGISYPGGKWITQTGLELLPFCILFTFCRIAFQLPVVWKNGGAKVEGWKQWRLLLALGLVGATLRFSEFFGIVEGLPVSLVSFLVYLHPVWTIVFSRWLNGENINRLKLTKIFFALIGTALVVDLTSVSNLGSMLGHLWSPIAAGMLISLWICLSTRSQQEGTSVVSVSFYYDLSHLYSKRFCFHLFR
jgi:drug/metabolite transporter (DMT)-like permease